jgi:hypothetical protein
MLKSLVALALTAGFVAQPAAAATSDAFSSFNATQGAGGFTYGTFDGTTFTPFGQSTGCSGIISDTVCLNDGSLPAAFKTTSGAHQSGSVIVPADALILHPGPNAGQDSAVVFTAPTSGNYNVALSTFVADNAPTGVNIYAFELGGPDVLLTTLDSSHLSYSISAPVFLTAGDVIGLAVDYDGVYYHDATGVNFTVSSVPEPAAWSMMFIGFGLAGAAMRRRAGLARA